VTPEARRIAIAEACGWKEVEFGVGPNNKLCLGDEPQWHNRKIESYVVDRRVPDYLNDLNAIHESIHAQPISVKLSILSELEKLLAGPCDTKLRVTFATAAQCAEAFLRTIGKWVD
jgi:hypothetical protein